MEKWLESVYSDGSEQFVSNPDPDLGETIKIKLRVYDDAPVDEVYLRVLSNGMEKMIQAELEKVENGLAYYSACTSVNEEVIRYYWCIISSDQLYFYNQKGISKRFPDPVFDFKILSGYDQPSWVRESVFYQIFPERFCNGNTENDVKDGEYEIDGFKTIKIKNWEEEPSSYEESHCLDFYGGDLNGIRKKIPYLKELGVNALYLNPIFTAPSVHKYDCIDYREVDPHFGGNKALIELVEELHRNDMKIILDISINHTGSNHKWFNKDAIFYDKSTGAFNNPQSIERNYYFFDGDEYKGWADLGSMPELNFTSQNLRDEVYSSKDSILKKWLKPPYNIDGWRFDVADTFAKNDEVQLADEIWPDIRKNIKEENKNAYILAEDWSDCFENLQGYTWDSPMNYYGCARVLRSFAGEKDLILKRYPFLDRIKNQLSAEDVVDTIISYLGKIPFKLWENQFNLIDSHDVSRLHNNPEINEELYRGIVMLQFALIGTPSIFYGDELAIDGRIDSNEGCRYPMPWSNLTSKQDIYSFYQKLISLKRTSNALKYGGMKFLYAKSDVIVLARFFNSEIYIIAVSRSNKKEEVTIPFGIIGSRGPKEKIDIFGQVINYEIINEKELKLVLKPYQSLFMDFSNS